MFGACLAFLVLSPVTGASAGPVAVAGAPSSAIAPYPILGDAWDGHEVLAWGGDGTGNAMVGAFDPIAGEWLSTAQPPLSSVVVAGGWTGRELVLVDKAGHSAGYDPGHRRWRRLPPNPELVGRTGVQVAAAVVDHRLVVAQGSGGLVLLDPAHGWRHLPDIPGSPASSIRSFAGGPLTVLTQSPYDGTPQPVSAATFDVRAGIWRPAASAPAGVENGTLVPVGDHLIVWRPDLKVGDSSTTPPAVSWDPAAGVWSVLAPSPIHGAATFAGVVGDGGALLVAGDDIHRDPIVATYRPGTGWRQTPAPLLASLLRRLNNSGGPVTSLPAVLAGRHLVLLARDSAAKSIITEVVDLDALSAPSATSLPVPTAALPLCAKSQLTLTHDEGIGGTQHVFTQLLATNMSAQPCRLDSPIRLIDPDRPLHPITTGSAEDTIETATATRGPRGSVTIPAGGSTRAVIVITGGQLCQQAGSDTVERPHAALEVGATTVPVATVPAARPLATCGDEIEATPWLANDWVW